MLHRFWADVPSELLAIAFVVAVGVLFGGAVVIADLRAARRAGLVSEREQKRDQVTARRRRRLKTLQARLGLRRSA